jgi:hypothetical protein
MVSILNGEVLQVGQVWIIQKLFESFTDDEGIGIDQIQMFDFH